MTDPNGGPMDSADTQRPPRLLPQSHWVEWLDREIEIWEQQNHVLVLRDIRNFIASMLPPEEA